MPLLSLREHGDSKKEAGRASDKPLGTGQRPHCRYPPADRATERAGGSVKVSENKAGALEVDRLRTSITLQRVIMLRALNCFRMIPAVGRRSIISSCTRLPGFSTG